MKKRINWDNTVAYSLNHSNPFNHIYINVKGRDPNGIVESDEYDSIERKIYNAKITDITPTILHMFSIPIPDDIDGEVLMDIFKEKSILKSNKVIYFKPEDEKYRIKEKILKLKENHKI